MLRGLTLSVAGVVWLSAAALPAQDAVLAQMYGSGVHAYFAQDYLKAHEALTAAINSGTADPRAYYFRGLAYQRLGRPEEAAADFQKGAELEAKDVNRVFNVARALERVQGTARSSLESYRVEARVKALAAAEEYRKARYEQLQEQERRIVAGQATRAEQPVEPPSKPVAPGDTDPFSAKPAEPVAKPTAEPAAEPEQKPQPEPPSTTPEPKMPAEADPFSGKPEKPDTTPPPVVPTVPPTTEPATPPTTEPATPPTTEPATPPTTEPAMPPTTEPATPPTGERKPGGVLGALGRALGKAAGGDQPATPTVPDVPPPGPATTPPEATPPEATPPTPPPAKPEEPVAPPGKVDPGDPFSTPAPAPPPTSPATKPTTPPPAKKPAFNPNDPFAEEPPPAKR